MEHGIPCLAERNVNIQHQFIMISIRPSENLLDFGLIFRARNAVRRGGSEKGSASLSGILIITSVRLTSCERWERLYCIDDDASFQLETHLPDCISPGP